jgi:hypothetical protein
MAQKPQMKIMYIHDDGANYNNYENDDEKRWNNSKKYK